MEVKSQQIIARGSNLDANDAAPLGAQLIALRDLALALAQEVERSNVDSVLDLESGISLTGVIRSYEINLIKRALKITNGNQLRASELLGLKATTLNAKMKRYDLGNFSHVGALEDNAVG